MPDPTLLSGSQLVSALGMTLVDFLWQGALLAGAYALAITLLKSNRWARLRLAIGHLTLMCFALAPALTLGGRLSAMTPVTPGAVVSGDTTMATVAAAGSATLEGPAHAFLPWLVAIWLLCVAVLAARGLWRWRRIRQVCLSATPLSDLWCDRVAQLHLNLGVRIRVRVLQSVQVATPILVGWLRPTILLPVGLCSRLTVQQVELILAHELAHVRRLDAWANALQSALETVLFYHPAVHWVGRRIRNDREMACDQWVAQAGIDRFDYARALLALAEEHRHRSLTGLALAATGGALLARIEAVLQTTPDNVSRRRLEGQLPTALLAALILLMTLLLGISDRKNDEASGLVPLAASPISIARLTPTMELLINDLQTSRTSVPPLWAVEEPSANPPSASPIREASPAEVSAGVPKLPLPRLGVEPAPLVLVAPIALSEAAVPPLDPDTAPVTSNLSEAVPATGAALPRPLQHVAPAYPRSAQLRGDEGRVTLSFVLAASGQPADIEVVDATTKTFAKVAAEALAQWRFPSGFDDGRRHQQEFQFMLSSATAQDECRPLTGSRLCRNSETANETLHSAESRGVRVIWR